MHSRTKSSMNFYSAFSLSCLVFMLCSIPNLVAKPPTENRGKFSDPFNKFNHLVVDKVNGSVFIGAVNRLYHLSPDLQMREKLSTILIFNSETEITDNYNKILVLDYENSRLISCGSHSQGSCEIYKIETRLREMKSTGEPVTVSNPNASTVAFIAPGPPQKKKSVLYVGVTNTKNNTDVPAVSTRSLNEDKLFQKFKSGSSFHLGTQISFDQYYRKNHSIIIVNYVYGFSSGSYSFFLTTQMESAESSPYISKLVRICQRDENYNSYTEIPIKCTDKSGNVYNLVQAAFITTPSSELANSLSIESQADVLFGVFSASKQSLGNESNKPSNKSALCIYSLEAINRKFDENIQNCFDGKGERGLEYIIPKQKCAEKNSAINSCGLTLGTPFGGNLPVQATAVTTFDTLVTAVTAVSKTYFTLAIVGTHTGRLQLLGLMNTTSVLKFNDINLGEKSPVNSDLQFDPKNEYLYAMTEHELTKILIRDHLPFISNVKPDKGPWEGGTKVAIGIKNIDNIFEGNNLEIIIGGIPCIPYENEFKPSEIVCITNSSSSSLKVHSGPIAILVNGIRVADGEEFTFVNPKIFKVSPKEPTTSRAELLIEGEHLNAGDSINVFIGNVPCLIIFNNPDSIQCNANLSPDDLEGNITVKIDESIRIYRIPFSDIDILKSMVNNLNRGLTFSYLFYIALLCLVVLIFIVIVTCFVTRKKFMESSRALMKTQQSMNNVCMETIALRQCIKQIVIEKHIDLNEESSNILKLPNISILYIPIQEVTAETSPELDYLLPLDDAWEFSRNKLMLRNHIGEGEFGKVFRGEASGILYEDVTTTVAVKMLKDTHSDADIIALASEMEMMKLIGTHENVLRLLGCCTQDGDLLVITEYAFHGNLRDFLRKYLSSANNKIMSKNLCEKDLLMFSVQIANGMEYLASIKCIHRDLAARNVLVSEDYVMKIGDFGLARDIHQTDYYRKKSDGRLPIKWMAPEGLCHSVYTTQSDVWSYGILLWEIMTLGGAPYPSFPDVGKLYQALQSGYRMEKPPSCSQTMYNLMNKCWSFVPENRPTFSIIIQNLEEIMSLSNDNVN